MPRRSPGPLVLVTNGTYATAAGGVWHADQPRAVTKPLTLASVNGPRFTIIQGYQVPARRTATALSVASISPTAPAFPLHDDSRGHPR